MKLSISTAPMIDELWQGYAMRLALMNGFESLSQFEKLCFYPIPLTRHSFSAYPESLSFVCERMKETPFFPSIHVAIQMTPYFSEADALLPAGQAKLSESFLWDISSPTTPTFFHRTAFRYHLCPECMKHDFEEYGFFYLHLSHHLPGVRICTKHKRPLLAFNRFDKRRFCTFDYRKGNLELITDLDAELQNAYRMEEAQDRNSGLLIRKTCTRCGKEYLIHPYSEQTGLGCPFCLTDLDPIDLLNHRLQQTYNGEYIVKDSFNSISHANIIHVPCGNVKRCADRLIWGTPRGNSTYSCSKCRLLTRDKIQKRVDPLQSEYVILSLFRNESTKRAVSVFHKTCGQKFNILERDFERRPHCIFCDRKQQPIDIEAVAPGYHLISDYKNNRSTISILHTDCGIVFKTSKNSFVDGKRCPICTPRYNLKSVQDALDKCATGYHVEKTGIRGRVNLYFHHERIADSVPYSQIMTDLQSEVPHLILERTGPYLPNKSIRRRIYDAIVLETRAKGFWVIGDGIEGHTTTPGERNIIQNLTNQCYIERLERGKYRALYV